MKIETYTTVTHSISLPIFGQSFTFNTPKKLRVKEVEKHLDLFAQKVMAFVVEAHWEWGRGDDRKVILLYTTSSNYGHVEFMFAVEADETLVELMKHSSDEMKKIKYHILQNFRTLNFDV